MGKLEFYLTIFYLTTFHFKRIHKIEKIILFFLLKLTLNSKPSEFLKIFKTFCGTVNFF